MACHLLATLQTALVLARSRLTQNSSFAIAAYVLIVEGVKILGSSVKADYEQRML